jgi:hypothetical protein
MFCNKIIYSIVTYELINACMLPAVLPANSKIIIQCIKKVIEQI